MQKFHSLDVGYSISLNKPHVHCDDVHWVQDL